MAKGAAQSSAGAQRLFEDGLSNVPRVLDGGAAARRTYQRAPLKGAGGAGLGCPGRGSPPGEDGEETARKR
eukprot:14392311-Alexandrium_andersonii.AAC.1